MSYSVTQEFESEEQLQAACFLWSWNEMPITRRLISYNLNNSKNKIDGARNKAKGIVVGRADLEFLWNGQLHYIELKFDNGSQSKGQKRFQDAVIKHGAKYHIIDDLQQFKDLVCTIINS